MIEQQETALKRLARHTTFHTTEERDAWINNELRKLDVCGQNAQRQVNCKTVTKTTVHYDKLRALSSPLAWFSAISANRHVCL